MLMAKMFAWRYVFQQSKYDRFFILSRELAALKPDLIVTAAGVFLFALQERPNHIYRPRADHPSPLVSALPPKADIH
jgi:hypothetical protein